MFESSRIMCGSSPTPLYTWFEISANYDIYRQHHIKIWGTRYAINPKKWAGIWVDITEMNDVADIDDWYW